MDIFQTIISHYPKWSKIELITVIIVMIISLIILERYYKKNKITKAQMCFSILFIFYMFMDQQYFLDYQVLENIN